MNPVELIHELCQFPHRVAGSSYEQKAAEIVAKRLKQIGLAPITHKFRWPPSYSWSLALHFGLLFASELALVRGYASIAATVALLTCASLWGEVSGKFVLLGRLVPRIESTNVVARFGAREPTRRLVVTAHIDTARSGIIFHPYVTRFLWENTKAGVLTIPFFASMSLGALVLFKSMGAGGFVMDALSLLLNLTVGISTLLLVEREVSGEPVCGANDNASGIAAAMAAADRLASKQLKSLEVVLAFTGAGEVNAGGMLQLLRTHPEFASEETYILNVESVGRGPLMVSVVEGPLLGKPTRIELTCLVLTAAKRAKVELSSGRIRFTSDAFPAAIRNIKAATVFGAETDFVRRSPKDTPENIDERSITDAVNLICEVASLLERGA